MIGVDFGGFIILLALALIAAAILHYGFKFYAKNSLASFFGELTIGYVGAWVSSWVLGYWPAGWEYENIYFIPAFLGALGLIVVYVEFLKSLNTAKED